MISIGVLALLCAPACGEPTEDQPAPDVPQREATSDFENYYVEFAPSEEPIPFNRYFELQVDVYTDATKSEPVEAAELAFDAEVVKLGAGLPTQPQVEPVGDGSFVVRGLLLHVPRRWEFEFQISEDGFQEEAVAVIDPTRGFERGSDPGDVFTDREVRRILSFSPEGGPPLPPAPSNAYADDPKAARLGQFLFFDTRLSGNGEVSCATCHNPDDGFADGKRLAEGIDETPRHAPTVLNAAFNRWQFWDGRTDSLWAQSLQPLEADAEHGTNRMHIVHLIDEDDEYREAYEDVFGELDDFSDPDRFPEHARPLPNDPEHPEHQSWMAMTDQDRQAVTAVYANLGKAIGAYERRIVRLDAPFDEFVQGLREGDRAKMDAIGEPAKKGLKLFVGEAQCDLCHSGALLSNFEFHNLGLGPRDWLPRDDDGRFSGTGQLDAEEFSATGAYSDASDALHPSLRFMRREEFLQKGAFKTPTLRNIAETAPYMHGGHFDTLTEVLQFYGDLQEDAAVGRRDDLVQPFKIESEQVDQLAAFMETLTGEPLPQELTEKPSSPVSPN